MPHARWLLEQSEGDDGWEEMAAGSRQRLALLLGGGGDRNRGWGLKQWRAELAEWWMECWGGLMAEWVADTEAGRAEAERQARAAARAKRREAVERDDATADVEMEEEVEVVEYREEHGEEAAAVRQKGGHRTRVSSESSSHACSSVLRSTLEPPRRHLPRLLRFAREVGGRLHRAKEQARTNHGSKRDELHG